MPFLTQLVIYQFPSYSSTTPISDVIESSLCICMCVCSVILIQSSFTILAVWQAAQLHNIVSFTEDSSKGIYISCRVWGPILFYLKLDSLFGVTCFHSVIQCSSLTEGRSTTGNILRSEPVFKKILFCSLCVCKVLFYPMQKFPLVEENNISTCPHCWVSFL